MKLRRNSLFPPTFGLKIYLNFTCLESVIDIDERDICYEKNWSERIWGRSTHMLQIIWDDRSRDFDLTESTHILVLVYRQKVLTHKLFM